MRSEEFKKIDPMKWYKISEEKFIDKLGTPIAVVPNRLNSKITAQSGVFTIHGGKTYPQRNTKDDEIQYFPKPQSLEELNKKLETTSQFIRSFIIPKEAKTRIREELFNIGIHKGMLFPDLESQASYIKDVWSQDFDE